MTSARAASTPAIRRKAAIGRGRPERVPIADVAATAVADHVAQAATVTPGRGDVDADRWPYANSSRDSDKCGSTGVEYFTKSSTAFAGRERLYR